MRPRHRSATRAEEPALGIAALDTVHRNKRFVCRRWPPHSIGRDEAHHMKQLALAACAVGVILTAAPSAAHHSFAATYFEDQTVTIEGQILQFVFRNPHSFVHLVVK